MSVIISNTYLAIIRWNRGGIPFTHDTSQLCMSAPLHSRWHAYLRQMDTPLGHLPNSLQQLKVLTSRFSRNMYICVHCKLHCIYLWWCMHVPDCPLLVHMHTTSATQQSDDPLHTDLNSAKQTCHITTHYSGTLPCRHLDDADTFKCPDD